MPVPLLRRRMPCVARRATPRHDRRPRDGRIAGESGGSGPARDGRTGSGPVRGRRRGSGWLPSPRSRAWIRAAAASIPRMAPMPRMAPSSDAPRSRRPEGRPPKQGPARERGRTDSSGPFGRRARSGLARRRESRDSRDSRDSRVAARASASPDPGPSHPARIGRGRCPNGRPHAESLAIGREQVDTRNAAQ